MKKTLFCLVALSLFTTGSAFAAGYRIPEQSADSTAKAGANIASASAADAAYFNPAGAALLRDGWLTEIDFTYIHLTGSKYKDNRTPLYNGESRNDDFLLPTIFMLSPKWHDVRFGFSVTAPYGLARRWDNPYPKTFAEKFSVQVYDINPTVSYALFDKLSFAVGWRVLYAKATVMSNGTVGTTDVPGMGTVPITASRALSGDTTEWGGWNAAIDFKPTKEWNWALTYRSHVDLDYEGDAILKTNIPPYNNVTTKGRVTVAAPAVLALSTSYTFFDKLTVELTIDRTFWSKYENLDFQYNQQIYNPVLKNAFNTPVNKDWDDSNAYRLGLEYAVTKQWTLMGGIAYDETPAPDATVGFELPDSNAWLFSLGSRYAFNDRMEVGLGVLYDMKTSRSVNNIAQGGRANGEFSDMAGILVSLGFQYRF